MSKGLLTVMAGYSAGPWIPRSTQLWVEALRRHSRHLLLVFDNPAPAELPPDWQGSDLTLVFERHGAYDFGSYRRGLELAQARGLLAEASHVLLCNDSVLGPLGIWGRCCSACKPPRIRPGAHRQPPADAPSAELFRVAGP